MKALFDRRTILAAAGAMVLVPPPALAVVSRSGRQMGLAASDINRGRKPVLLHAPPVKWDGVVKRHAAQEKRYGLADSRCGWVRLCHAAAGGADLATARMVNGLVNAIPYRRDREDVWSTPREFANHGGDCEDFAVAKYFLLQRFGFPKDSLGVLVCMTDNFSNVAHAVTILKYKDEIFILDNLHKNVYKYEDIKMIKPIYLLSLSLMVGFLSV